MELLLGISIISLFAAVVLLFAINALKELCGKFYFRLDNLEIDFTESDLFENDEPQSAVNQQSHANVIEFKSAKKSKVTDKIPEKETEDTKDFWDDLDALEEEKKRIESGGSGTDVFDNLDHARAVTERIADLRDTNAPPAA